MAEIKFKHKEKTKEYDDNAKLQEFVDKHKKLFGIIIAVVALIIVGINWHKSSVEATRKLVVEDFFSVQDKFENSKYDEVTKTGQEFVTKYAGYNQASEAIILVARSYNQLGKTNKAIKYLEDHLKDASLTKFSSYSARFVLAGLYFDRFSEENKADDAKKAAKLYEEASASSDGLNKGECRYLAALAYLKAGAKEEAGKIIEKEEKNSELNYQLKSKFKTLKFQL